MHLFSGAFTLRRPAPHRLEIREGGGCLALFGTPFLVTGLLTLGLATGLVPVSNPEDLPGWGWAVLVVMGLAFAGVGGALVFGRRHVSFDLGRQAAQVSTGVLFFQRAGESHGLSGFDAVHLRFEAGDADTADSFPVVLRARAGGPGLALVSSNSYHDARKAAVEIAGFLQWPLVDGSTRHESVIPATQLDASLRQRARDRPRDGDQRAEAPRAPRAGVRVDGAALVIVVPPAGVSRLRVVLALVPLCVAVALVVYLRAFFVQTRTPGGVQVAFLGFVALCFGVLPCAAAVRQVLVGLRGSTEIRTSAAGITIARRGAWRTATIGIPADDIIDVDHDGPAVPFEHEAAAPHDGQEPGARAWLLRGAMAAASRIGSRGVTIKTRRELIRVGEGLSSDEARYLCERIAQTLRSDQEGSGEPS